MEIARRSCFFRSRAELGSISSSRCQITRTLDDAIASARIEFLNERVFRKAFFEKRRAAAFAFKASRLEVWWSQTGSNRRPPACKAGALPTELWPRQGSDISNR